MEIWVLLAAAGSGYLAHCWQNLRKSREASSDASDKDDNNDSGSTRRYFHYSSAYRRFKESSYQNGHVSRLSDDAGNMTAGFATYLYDPSSDVEGTDETPALQNDAILDACSCSKISTYSSQTGLDAAGSCLTNTKDSRVSLPTCPSLHTHSTSCALNCCGFDCHHHSRRGCRLMSPKGIPGYWHSAYCLGDSATDGSDSMLYDEMPYKLTFGAHDIDMTSEEEACLYDETSISHASEDVSVLETSTSFMVHQERHSRSKINTRKVRPHQKNCRNRRSRNLGSHLPSTPSESCSLQLGDVRWQQEGEINTHSSSACELLSNGLKEQSGNELADAIVSDSLLNEGNGGFLSASGHQRRKILDEIKKTVAGDQEAVKIAHLPSLPLQNSRRPQVNVPIEISAAPGGDCCLLQGTDSLMKTVLFNFGVGVGMMFTILSSKHGSMELMGQLEDTLCSLKELEAEVYSKTKLMFQTKGTREDALAEQLHELFKLVMRIFDAVQGMRNLLPQDLACLSAMDVVRFKERAMLEAELEAELEKMEMDLSIGDISDLGQRFSNEIEDDLKVGKFIRGELAPTCLLGDAESITESDGGTDSSYGIIQHRDFAVSAVELARRLRDVLEIRQEQEILELEAEVKHLDGRLQAKQKELQVWKQRVLHLLQGGISENFSSLQEKDVCVQAVETAEKICRAGEACSDSAGKRRPTFDSSLFLGCNEGISSNGTTDACLLHRRLPQPSFCSTHEADDEVSDQFLNSMATGSSSSSPNGLSTGAHAKGDGKGGMPLSHEELETLGFVNDATDDTPDNSPCLVKLMDKHTILHHNLEGKLEHKAGICAHIGKSLSNSDTNEELVVHTSRAKSCPQDKPSVCAQDVVEISESYRPFRHALDWSTPEEGLYSSDLDDKLGQMLIKRVVEKSKKGSLIVEAAQSAMASFDNER